ncbi:hypothetical protein PQX77_002710 [Marasmius sp. AFHP31]|nr:hypothetical protein PQX77_002710 [Marasmius sp. AFHP31]
MGRTTRLSKNLLLVSACLSFLSTRANANCAATNHLLARADNDTQSWNELSWGKLEPTKDLRWVECYRQVGEFECARLQVPLNYHEPEGDSAALALVRLAANLATDSSDYRGPVLFNPGGPGHSGVDFILNSGPSLRAVMGPEYDLVGFDPRGVQRSTPRVEFYESRVERLLMHRPAQELNHSSLDIGNFWASNKLIGTVAGQRDKKKNVLAHINTDHSARDMLTITEAHGREKLQYWGLSYGSVLGYTFASMFPDKVERLVIDGIVDPEDYYRTNWFTGTKDSAKTIRWFFESCKEAGPDGCAFYEDSVEAMESKLNDIYASLIKAPIPVQTSKSNGIVDYSVARASLVLSLYSPTALWRRLATALQDLSQGNAITVYTMLGEATPFECECNESKYEFEHVHEGLIAYICNDGDPVPAEFEAAQAHYQASTEYSPLGSVWAGFRIACNGWSKDIPKAKFRGPIGGNTSFPMLVIGNTADPVTPLEAAKNATLPFPGSVVLTRDSPGHGSTNTPSACTAKAIREYFINGTLPKEGTVCPMDGSPFDDPKKQASGSGSSDQKADSTSESTKDEFESSSQVASDGHVLKELHHLARRGFNPGFTRRGF